uniref:Endoglucanase n=1 Tax=Fagus sylvatica TaxID=28930 RepID=A0A2N9EH71_FAGSY
MHSANHWGGSFEINHGEVPTSGEYDRSRTSEWDGAALYPHQNLDETQQSWLLGPQEKKKKKYVDFGCIVISHKALKWILGSLVVAFCVIGLPIIIATSLPKHKSPPITPDNYSDALHKALLFFNAQKWMAGWSRIWGSLNKVVPCIDFPVHILPVGIGAGKLPKNNGIPWRGNSGLSDGNDTTDVKGGLVGGYYDAGDNIKFHFPMAYAMTMLSWSVIEYHDKYKTIGEYDHVRDLIKWGTDYLLLTFNSSATKINKIYCQVGGHVNGSQTPDDHNCWQKPEDMDYPRPTITCQQGPDLAGEMAAALASASIVFKDDGNSSYLSLATNPGIPKNSKAFYMIPDLSVPSWDNKLPAAMLLLTRLRLFLNPGYPYEDMLQMYHNVTGLNMCSYLHSFHVFNWTHGGLIMLSRGKPQDLQYVANTAFLASLFVDYMNATGVPGWYCGPNYVSSDVLRSFATSQMDYILGKNPMNMSYLVGYGKKFPRHVHHRGASTPNDHKYYSCTGGWKWFNSKNANPNNIIGAMVGGPDQFDQFSDLRDHYNNTEPTMAGNAGLVAALVSLTTTAGNGIDKNTIFSAVPPLYPQTPPPPPPWKP